jgi:hypothetical protein
VTSGLGAQSRFRRVVLAACAVVVASAGKAFAGTISTPGTSPFAVPGDAAGHPSSFTVVAQDFGEADAVVVEQCDGADPDSPSWSVTAHCDSGSATGVVLADVDGNATFPPTTLWSGSTRSRAPARRDCSTACRRSKRRRTMA